MNKPVGYCSKCEAYTESAWSQVSDEYRCTDCGSPTFVIEDDEDPLWPWEWAAQKVKGFFGRVAGRGR